MPDQARKADTGETLHISDKAICGVEVSKAKTPLTVFAPESELADEVPPSHSVTGLTELEAHVLAQIAVNGPLTAYDVLKVLARSPVSTLSGSTGAIYPIVKRLRSRGLITSTPVAGAGRRTETLACTEDGQAAAALWVSKVNDADLLPHDPLRSKVLFFSLLTKPQQMKFLIEAGRALDDKLDRIAEYARSSSGSYVDLASAGALATVKERRRWIDDVLLEISQT